MSATAALIASTLNAGTPLLLAGIGILIHERSGVLNLGIEGIMLMGAAAGFGTCYLTGSFFLGFAAAALVGMVLSALFGFLTLGLYANQNAAGLAMAIFGAGLALAVIRCAVDGHYAAMILFALGFMLSYASFVFALPEKRKTHEAL